MYIFGNSQSETHTPGSEETYISVLSITRILTGNTGMLEVNSTPANSSIAIVNIA